MRITIAHVIFLNMVLKIMEAGTVAAEEGMNIIEVLLVEEMSVKLESYFEHDSETIKQHWTDKRMKQENRAVSRYFAIMEGEVIVLQE